MKLMLKSKPKNLLYKFNNRKTSNVRFMKSAMFKQILDILRLLSLRNILFR